MCYLGCLLKVIYGWEHENPCTVLLTTSLTCCQICDIVDHSRTGGYAPVLQPTGQNLIWLPARFSDAQGYCYVTIVLGFGTGSHWIPNIV